MTRFSPPAADYTDSAIQAKRKPLILMSGVADVAIF
jgi:hypothetical protein